MGPKKLKIGRRLRAIFYPLSAIYLLLPGCLKETKPVAAVDKSPLIIDDAMVLRDWKRSTVRFQNGETPAVPTGFILRHNPNAPKWVPAITDGPMFVANIFLMPVGYIFTPPWTRVIYPAGVVEPSYTAVPPIK
jgi:hypothetical protein